MRSRNIKVGFWNNEDIAKLSHLGRLLFIGLWCLADRDGKLENRPERIRHQLFVYDKDQIDINGELTVIERLGFICTYQVDGIQLIKILKFKEHQHPHNTEAKSKLPDPIVDKNKLNVSPPLTNRYDTVNVGLNPGVLNPDSLNPDSTPPAPSGAVHELIAYFHTKLTEKMGEKPASFNGGILGKTFAVFLKSQTVDEAKRRLDNWFLSTDPFIQTNGYSPTLFTTKLSLLKGGPIHARKSVSNHVRLEVADSARQSAYAD